MSMYEWSGRGLCLEVRVYVCGDDVMTVSVPPQSRDCGDGRIVISKVKGGLGVLR